MKTQFLAQCFPLLERSLLEEMEASASIKSFAAGEYIVRQGQYIRFLPMVLSGNVKVFNQEDAIQFLLYYIASGETCIFSFAHILNEGPSEFSAIAELDSELLLLPMDKVRLWLTKYPSFCNMVLKDYQKHYEDLLHTTKQIVCHNLESRLLNYLQNKSEREQSDVLKISHQDIADDLGTSREVISRLMRKLAADGKAIQEGRKIKIL
ncbi:Crp/Fnr family transcriptional regulator [Aureisphaera galaxeae]|uniref:Crp/Fnr family transcriptional regulator n=1 Tax=Aureisphaera galaxeae TaxID=1538023 RepID=UPI002350BDE9|nr:Crp/Fnr family transcriptional regulator [Aureisphaera galaxeae]MDC8003678.1 Crp/Fnr family transcriptional regulator [Aureisphaera galaxeae]